MEKRISALPLISFVALCLIIFSIFHPFLPAFATKYSIARIVNVDCPIIVKPSQSFQILVTAEYEESLYVDIGIRDVDKDDFVQALTLISNFHGPGEELFTFNLTAPDQEGVWHLEAITRAWWLNAWFGDPLQGNKKFDVQIKNFMEEKIVLYANITNQISKDVRFRLKGWSDGVESNPREISTAVKIKPYPIYKKQFFMRISSQLDFVKGGGWYDEGNIAKLEAPSKAVFEGKVYSFNGWRGDIESDELKTEILMDENKKVDALWIEEISYQIPLARILFLVSIALFFGAILIGLIFLTKKRRMKIFSLFLILLILLSFVTPSTNALTEGNAFEKIKIGDTVWRYWNNPDSDTCLIWLGGGINSQPLFINPFWMESFNTMRYVQDLARFYSVLAIEEGSKKRFQAVLERNIYGEVYEGSAFIDKARNWLSDAGYSHIYMVGYSVGGIAAAREGIREHAGRWRSPSGIILITVPKDKSVWQAADKLRGNLLLLYGEKMTESFIKAGEEFLEQTPSEGEQEWGWLNKGIYIMPEVAHEVWTIAENGIYNPKATWITVEFIERAKMLGYSTKSKIENVDMKFKTGVTVKTTVEPRLTLEEPLRILLTITGLDSGEYTCFAEPLIEGLEPSIFHINNFKNEKEVLLIIPQAPNNQLKFRLFIFSEEVEYLGTYEAILEGPLKLRIMANFEGIPILIDGVEYETGKDGITAVEILTGEHIIEVPLYIDLGIGSRLYFKGWDNWSNSTRISIEVNENSDLPASYSRQFLVEGHTNIGKINGGGWYDENSTTTLEIEDEIIEENDVIYIFEGWNVSDVEIIDDQIFVRGPSNVEAVWTEAEIPISTLISESDLKSSIVILGLSITVFLFTLIISKKRFHIRSAY